MKEPIIKAIRAIAEAETKQKFIKFKMKGQKPLTKIRIAVPDFFMSGLNKILEKQFGVEFEVLDIKSKPKNVLLSYNIKDGKCGPDSFVIRGKFTSLFFADPAIQNIVSILKTVLLNMMGNYTPSKSDEDNFNWALGYLQNDNL